MSELSWFIQRNDKYIERDKIPLFYLKKATWNGEWYAFAI